MRNDGCPNEQMIVKDLKQLNGQTDPRRAFVSQKDYEIWLCKQCRMLEKLDEQEEEKIDMSATSNMKHIASVSFDTNDGRFKPNADFFEIIKMADEEQKLYQDSLIAMTPVFEERRRKNLNGDLPEEDPEDADEY